MPFVFGASGPNVASYISAQTIIQIVVGDVLQVNCSALTGTSGTVSMEIINPNIRIVQIAQ
jgi:hypothetical protein